MSRIRFALLAALAAALAVAPEFAAAHLEGRLTSDVADLGTSRANRILLENMLERANGGVVKLPAGTIHLDRSLDLKPEYSGATIEGVGPESILRNSHATSTYWTNPTLVAQGSGFGYADVFTRGDDANRVTLDEGPDLKPYSAGTLVYAFQWDGYTLPDSGLLATRRRIIRQVGLRSFQLDGPVDPRCNRLKWLDATPIRGPAEGDAVVQIEDRRDLKRFTIGMPVFLTDGPTLANEARGEFRKIAAIDAAAGTVRLDRPPRTSYAAASALVFVKPVRNVTLRNFTIGRPKHPGGVAYSFKFCTDWRMDNVRSEFVSAIGGCGGFTLKNCESKESLNLNTSHDIRVERGKYRALYIEEGCFDIDAVDCLVGPAFANGVMNVVGCERVRLSRVRIFESAIIPIALFGRENVLDSVTVADTKQRQVNCYIGGDRTKTTGLKSDVPVVFKDGKQQTVAGVEAPGVFLGWVADTGSGGTARGLKTPALQVKSADWQVLPANVAAPAPPR